MFNRRNSLVRSASGGRVIPDDDIHFPTYSSGLYMPKDDLGFFPKRRASNEQIRQVESQSQSNTSSSPQLLSHPSKHF